MIRFKYLYFTLFFCAFNVCHAQLLDSLALDSAYVYTSIEEALKNPETVYKLKLKEKYTSIPEEVGKFTNLNVLDVSRNKLSELPEFLTTLNYLQRLDLGKNKFDHFPPQICRMYNLRELIISRNNMSGFPACIGNLEKLVYLDAWSNNISIFPEDMKKMVSLQEIDLREVNISDQDKIVVAGYFPDAKVHFSTGCNCGH